MLRFLSAVLILLWIILVIGSPFLYLSALVLYCTGQYVGSAICFVSSIIYTIEFIDNADQIPHYFYMMIHNHSEPKDDDIVPLMIYKDKKDS